MCCSPEGLSCPFGQGRAVEKSPWKAESPKLYVGSCCLRHVGWGSPREGGRSSSGGSHHVLLTPQARVTVPVGWAGAWMGSSQIHRLCPPLELRGNCQLRQTCSHPASELRTGMSPGQRGHGGWRHEATAWRTYPWGSGASILGMPNPCPARCCQCYSGCTPC